jgi:hypothetical protein
VVSWFIDVLKNPVLKMEIATFSKALANQSFTTWYHQIKTEIG